MKIIIGGNVRPNCCVPMKGLIDDYLNDNAPILISGKEKKPLRESFLIESHQEKVEGSERTNISPKLIPF